MKKNSKAPKSPASAVPDFPVSDAPIVTPPASQKVWSPLTVGLAVFVVFLLLSIVFFDTIVTQPVIERLLTGGRYQPDKFSGTAMLPTPSPTPIILKPDEGTKGNYTVSQSAENTGPSFSRVTFDPLDVQKGQTLTISVTIASQSPVSAVTGTVTGDTTSMPIVLEQRSKTAAISVWSAALPITDTLFYTYILRLHAVNETGASSVTVAPRS